MFHIAAFIFMIGLVLHKQEGIAAGTLLLAHDGIYGTQDSFQSLAMNSGFRRFQVLPIKPT
jgi:hypothetical protein